ncbi:cytochrome d ubiquinol oxidase subunit II [Cupriavidus plantarum]|uniref:Cytochrome bd-I ubiquinol oxidase subunit 2 apoprotein n=1 Tax=Cupriavidus plantarum TaxID=942865 RepID=A0A316F0S7_9BURK|nr:cytochrome d ubiquinol oxidase subunit II [Cupriavidus plantarum]NYH98666.1 cytochrome d ubiquinol oxidase subunit II [Cupriavidus plantarum]PWK37705.1 cytochrome bd-I ubiquinol oxidase subunit 2 apoprotein [Cupriavidus plantarum]REF01589.1 cytochrome bd-I ubiquinol oxidase subunit 2 apoprotein [Cupriavidus plantarum]CAG2128095.1 Cytochrome bd-I ubiquinol oxidase subunit 2 [Cupriavidus plantarum]SMR66725.1 cytochrome bd-I ubiquinol oxidase subunit 2 apoprotein [Cupriavidus plantarum]
MGIDLPLIWVTLIYFGVMMYVVMDGFDLGIGIMFPFVKDRTDRDVMMNTVAPVWDGNETWLVLGGAALFGAFPLAYGVVLSALYIPLIGMLLALIFRGVAFEFRFKASDRTRHLWDKAFIGGSALAGFFQGVALGAYINGIPVNGHDYTGGAFDWFAPFPLFTGLGVVVAYAFLGCTWLIMKTEGRLQGRMIAAATPLTAMMLIFIAVTSVWTPLTHPEIAQRWFSLPNLYWFAPVPLLVLASAFGIIRVLGSRPNAGPFLFALLMVFVGYTGLAISVWPNIIPPDVSIWQASSPPQSQGFTLVGALFIVPIILTYSSWSYYVFRGKVKAGEGYH